MTIWFVITWIMLTVAGVLVAWAVFSDPPRGRLRCPGGWRRVLLVIPVRRGCWYDMSGLVLAQPDRTEHECPECGRVSGRRDLGRRRLRWRGLVLAGLLVLGAYPVAVWRRVAEQGLWAGVPTWSLVMFAPVEPYCRGALGCRFSWGQMPEATRELMTPHWGREFSGWESDWLKSRLEAGIERVRGEFPGRDVVVLDEGEPRALALPAVPPLAEGATTAAGSSVLVRHAGLVLLMGDGQTLKAWLGEAPPAAP